MKAAEIPPPFDADVRPEIRRCLFGASELVPRAIFTPIPSIYAGLCGEKPPAAGWWPVRKCQNALAVLTPQSTSIIDAIACLEPDSEILFVGLAGSLGSLAVGDIVEPRLAILDGGTTHRSSSMNSRFPAAVVGGAMCLADSYGRTGRCQSGIDCIDIETAIVFATAEQQDKTAAALLLITDVIATDPFYRVDATAWRSQLPKLVAAVESWATGSA